MVDGKRQDSSRDLLEELEDGWATPPPPTASALARMKADAVAEEDEGRPSSPDVNALDEGWLDDLFPGEEGDDDEDEDDEEPEPELPDERLDPEAFALAKQAREERAAKKRERKRTKAEAKKARQKARLLAMRQKQKPKKNRAAAPARRAEKAHTSRTAKSDPTLADSVTTPADDDEDEDFVAARIPAAKPALTGRRASTVASVKLLAVVLAILLALAAVAAAVLK